MQYNTTLTLTLGFLNAKPNSKSFGIPIKGLRWSPFMQKTEMKNLVGMFL
jgi:hypothetical protein